MRHFICVWCVFISVWCISSCRTTKVVDKEENRTYHYTADSLHSKTTTSWAKAWIDEQIDAQAMWVGWEKLTIYDTSMEIDPNTGRPPILAEVERRDSAVSSTTIVTADSTYQLHEETLTDSAGVCVSDSAHIYTHEEKERQSTIGYDAKQLSYLLAVMTVLAFVFMYFKWADKHGW